MIKKTILAGGGLVENERGEILFMYRREKWDLPKGKLDPGETIEACALREVQEETGLREVTLGDLLIITRHEYEEKGMEILKETHWFRMKADSGSPLVPQAEEQITDLRWVDLKNFDTVTGNTYANIRELLTFAGYLKK